MNFNKPRGSRPEHPAALIERLRRNWHNLVVLALDEENTPGREADTFPVTMKIGSPSLLGEGLLRDRGLIQSWMTAWNDFETEAHVEFKTVTKRVVGQMTLPISLTVDTIDQLAIVLGGTHTQHLKRARAVMRKLVGLDTRLVGMSSYWVTLTQLTIREQDGFIELLRGRIDESAELGDLREVAIPGLHSKWIERNITLVRDALGMISLLKAGDSIHQELGYCEDDRQQIWMKFHPDDYINPMGDQEIGMRPSKIAGFPQSVTKMVIVENKATFNRHVPLPGVCLSFGSGNAISGTAAAITALKDMDICYWGDLDSFGMAILSRVRRILPKTTSYFMNADTMLSHKHLWTTEVAGECYKGAISDLTNDENEALAIIRSDGIRLEQERLTLTDQDLIFLGIVRETSPAGKLTPTEPMEEAAQQVSKEPEATPSSRWPFFKSKKTG